MIDANGFRYNIGIIIANSSNSVLLTKRVRQEAWQFPQGGLIEGEEPEAALFRELYEEVGLTEKDVKILGYTKNWLKYRIPKKLIRNTKPVCVGQKQRWYLLRLKEDEKELDFKKTDKPEFDDFMWVSYWYPLREVISFKYEVYRRALKELSPLLFNSSWRGSHSKPLNHLLS